MFKYQVLITAVFWLNFGQAQDKSDAALASETEKRLSRVISDLSSIDQSVKVAVYSDKSQLKQHAQLLEKLRGYLVDLDKIKNNFTEISNRNKNEKDYFVKLAYTDLAYLSIYSKRNQYLGSFTADDQLKLYLESWENYEFQHINSARTNCDKVVYIDKENTDAKIIGAIVSYYEGKLPEAYQSMSSLVAQLSLKRREISDLKMDVDAIDSYIGFLQSWMAYVCIEMKDFKTANTHLMNTISTRYPIDNVEWANVTVRKLNNVKKNHGEITVVPVNFGTTLKKKMSELTYVLDDKQNVSSIELKEDVKVETSNSPELLSTALFELWTALSVIEEYPWDLALAQFDPNATNPAKRFKDPSKLFIELTSGSRAEKSENVKRFLIQLDYYFTLYQNADYLRTCWTSLINDNPTIAYYRMMRLKSIVLMNHVCKSVEAITPVFDFTSFNTEFETAIVSSFKPVKVDAITTELDYLKQNFPTSMEACMAELDVAAYVLEPSKGLLELSSIAKTDLNGLKFNVYANNSDASSDSRSFLDDMFDNSVNLKNAPNKSVEIDFPTIVVIYKSYILWKMNDYKSLKEEIERMSAMKNTQYWSDLLERRLKLVESENKSKSNSKK